MRSPLYVLDPAAVVQKRGGRIVVTVDGEPRASAPLMLLSELVLLGPANVTTQALCALLAADCSVVFLRSDGRARGRLEPPAAPAVATRRRQYAQSASSESRLVVGRACLDAKLHNQRVALLRWARPSNDRVDLSRRAELVDLADQVEAQRANLHSAESLAQAVGFEGAAAAAYYRGLRLAAGGIGGFVRRDRRAGDLLNTALNYCSALVREVVVGAIVAAGLDPYVSFLHEPFRGRPTLAFDLMEEWRPVLVEGTALSAIGLGMVTPDDVSPNPQPPPGGLLALDARRRLVERFAHRLESPAGERHDGGREALTYRNAVLRQPRRLAAWLDGIAPDYEAFRWR